jgi:ribonucleotide reductase alpha subunit
MFINRTEWGSDKSFALNNLIHETIYYHAESKSAELGISEGSYPRYEGSPISKGILQCDLWGVTPITNYDWDGLREKCKKGMRNSLKIALMPTASTAQIVGNTESFEPITSNMYTRKVLSGEFPVVNKFLINDLKKIGLWSEEIVHKIMDNNGSIQSIPEIPNELKNLYKTVWEISQKILIDLSISRAPFIDQTQSLNIYLKHPSVKALSSLHLYTWEKGLKTGSYYIRSQAAVDPIKFTIKNSLKKVNPVDDQSKESKKKYICTDTICTSCST